MARSREVAALFKTAGIECLHWRGATGERRFSTQVCVQESFQEIEERFKMERPPVKLIASARMLTHGGSVPALNRDRKGAGRRVVLSHQMASAELRARRTALLLFGAEVH